MILPAVSVAVFVYNEANLIAACLDSIEACSGEAALSIFVLINGCTDRTDSIVRDYAVAHPNVHPIVIRLGDKANAWNYYTHQASGREAIMHAFIDGDVTITPGSITALLRTFDEDPAANGCAALPVGHRPRVMAYRRKLSANREMSGNFYALRGSFVDEIRRRNIRVPIGMFGEDGLVTALTRWNLDRGPDDCRRVTFCEDAGFEYEGLSLWQPSHLRIARNRMMRYAMRRQHGRMLYPLVSEQGVGLLPVHIVDLYPTRLEALRLEWRGIQTLFDIIAIRRIRLDAVAGERAKAEDRAHVYS
jgi:glycosyltransferase involved in cell wall biosynthesis